MPERPVFMRSGSSGRAFGVAALGIGNALTLVMGSRAAATDAELVATLAGALLGAAAMLWVALDDHFERASLAWVLGLALLLRLIAVQATPLLEDDHYRYLWDGMRTATALDPYRLPPSAFFGTPGLSPRWSDILSGINYPDIPTIYGPLLQWLFAAAHALAPGQLGGVQALVLVADMAVLVLLARQQVGMRVLLLYALHPLVLKEAMASAHPDGLVALWLLLATLAWQRGRALWVGVALGLAVSTKVAALVALPLLLLCLPVGATGVTYGTRATRATRASWVLRLLAGFALSVAALYGPFIAVGGSDASALRIFGTQWLFNPLGYRLLDASLPAGAARPTAALMVALGLGVLVWRWRRRARGEAAPEAPPLASAFALLLLCSPVVNLWYWLWALPLAHRSRERWVMAAAVVAMLSYLNTTVLSEAGWMAPISAAESFRVDWPVTLAQALLMALAWAWWRRRPSAATPTVVEPGRR